MGQKHYSKAIRDEAVLFYERGHSFAETRAKYGMAESTFLNGRNDLTKNIPCMNWQGAVPKPRGTLNFI